MLSTILYIEDDEGLARLMQKRMQRHGLSVQIALTARDGLQALATNHFDLILLDYHLPDIDGLELLKQLIPQPKTPPIIILTASGDERVALAALESGAADYAVKDTAQHYLDLLPAVMQAAFTKNKLARENEFQRRELEMAMAKAEQANQAKTDFLATMSHEIRTPMNAVVGLAELLGTTDLSEHQRSMVDTLRTNANVLLSLISDLLDISRVESGQIQLEEKIFSINTMLSDLHAMFTGEAKRKNLNLTLTNIPEQVYVIGDRTRLHQILMNLIGNALKFTEFGGITIDASYQHITPSSISRAQEDRGKLRVIVRDTGIGIAPEKISGIFDKFVQADQSINRRFGGSGLGLAICKQLAHLMGGDIEVASLPGSGSSFTLDLTLPTADAAHFHALEHAATGLPRLAVDNASTTPSSTEPPKVLLVEDYPANVMVATLMLEHLGYRHQVANTGLEAVEAVRQAHQPFYAVLMDVQMHGMDGYETTRQIRALELLRGMPRHSIIGLTAHALAGDRERCLAAGMDDYMTKPVQPELLAKKLANAGTRQGAA